MRARNTHNRNEQNVLNKALRTTTNALKYVILLETFEQFARNLSGLKQLAVARYKKPGASDRAKDKALTTIEIFKNAVDIYRKKHPHLSLRVNRMRKQKILNHGFNTSKGYMLTLRFGYKDSVVKRKNQNSNNNSNSNNNNISNNKSITKYQPIIASLIATPTGQLLLQSVELGWYGTSILNLGNNNSLIPLFGKHWD